MEFPRLVYKSASNHALANDAEQFAALMKDGWFASVPEAIAQKDASDYVKAADENAPPTRDELKQKATELGLVFAGNTGNEKLTAMIAEALKNKG